MKVGRNIGILGPAPNPAAATNDNADEAARSLIQRYVPGTVDYCSKAQTLASSLPIFCAQPDFIQTIEDLGASASCLFQGYSAPDNARTLRSALEGMGVKRVRIAAVDRLSLPKIYRRLGIDMPEIDFIQHEASSAAVLLGDQKFDLIVQDFVLNCMHPSLWPLLMDSARSVLSPNGIALISVSTDATVAGESMETVEDAMLDWPGRWTVPAWALAELAQTDEEYRQMMKRLAGRTLLDKRYNCVIQVTKRSGQLEFFRSKQDIYSMIENAGLRILAIQESIAVDYSGLCCNRIRLIAAGG